MQASGHGYLTARAHMHLEERRTREEMNILSNLQSRQNLMNNIKECDNESNVVCEVMIIHLSDVVIFPGDSLPLRLSKEKCNCLSALSETNDKLLTSYFGVVNSLEVNEIGTLVAVQTTNRSQKANNNSFNIVENRNLDNQAYNTSEEWDEMDIYFITRGTYRFRIINKWEWRDLKIASIEIIKEGEKISHYFNSQSLSLQQFPWFIEKMRNPQYLAKCVWDLLDRPHFKEIQRSALVIWGNKSDNMLLNEENENNENNENKGNFKDNDNCFLGCQKDPTNFSFCVSSNLPISNNDKLILLKSETSSIRLFNLIKILSSSDASDTALGCSICKAVVANKFNIFCVPGAEGVSGAYVNPAGYVHQTLTFESLSENSLILLHGDPCERDSWFPGYSWTIANCAFCGNHLGWRFTKNGVSIINNLNNSNNSRFSVYNPRLFETRNNNFSQSETGAVPMFWGVRSSALVEVKISILSQRDTEINHFIESFINENSNDGNLDNNSDGDADEEDDEEEEDAEEEMDFEEYDEFDDFED